MSGVLYQGSSQAHEGSQFSLWWHSSQLVHVGPIQRLSHHSSASKKVDFRFLLGPGRYLVDSLYLMAQHLRDPLPSHLLSQRCLLSPVWGQHLLGLFQQV